MRFEKPQKQLILANALKRMRRVSVYADLGFRARRQDVLAAYSLEGQKCFIAMKQALRQRQCLNSENLGAPESIPRDIDDFFKVAALSFVAEPAQRAYIERLELSTLSNFSYEPNIYPTPISHLEKLHGDNIGQLAWGAFSLKKVKQSRSIAIDKSERLDRMRAGSGDQLSLQDLAIIDCAVSYQDLHFDCSFMRRLSADGANNVHRVAMILANDYHARVDVAIITAAKVLSDPIVGGDANQCCLLLKGRQVPASWATQYDLD